MNWRLSVLTRDTRRINFILEFFYASFKKRRDMALQYRVKLRSYGLSFHEFRPRFALFPIVGTGRIEVVRGLVSASVASRVMAVNSLHVKEGGSGQTA
ncbi:hypothetical protein AVEN_18060-1 [Araneus ventricosus]|uniref:Uncharacterized protein n=1 Tax=Araneus ventricosus TaxID=182803 RepID=A0A4Y2GYP3_ARAVE|nr:hypothetical protein AVEN_18060-1 [Araneus ventricosus]